MKEIVLLICGCRDFKNKEYFVKVLSELSTKYFIKEIVHGACPTGVDCFANNFAKENAIPCTPFPAQWNIHGRTAGPIRNEKMANYIKNKSNGCCIAFWDGVSKGTKNMISLANKYGIPTMIIQIEKEKGNGKSYAYNL